MWKPQDSLIHGIEADRLKGVFITTNGTIGFNKADSTVTKMNLQVSSESLLDSRVEVISNRPDIFDDIEEGLLKCVVNPALAPTSLLEPALSLCPD